MDQRKTFCLLKKIHRVILFILLFLIIFYYFLFLAFNFIISFNMDRLLYSLCYVFFGIPIMVIFIHFFLKFVFSIIQKIIITKNKI